MNVLVCVKRVPAPGARINITPDGHAVDTAYLGFTISPHEECAVEEAVRIVEAHGGVVTVLTVGPAEAEEQLRYAVSVGASRAVLVPIEDLDWDPQRTARAISAAIDVLETRGPRFDLVLFGNESADSGGYQVGVRVAHALGRPIVNGIKDLEPLDDTVRVRRQGDAGVEVYELPLPAVVGVKEGINLPRYPTMKGRLASRKAEVVREPIECAAGGLRTVRLESPVEQATSTVVLGHGPEAAGAVVDVLVELEVV